MSTITIQILDDITANKIAAGEVVERPSSVVKELVENSIDAQSRTIEVEIADGGKQLIRVTDDGIGMAHDDALLSIKRHATSKIRVVEDLAYINSLGFRGEALPSIAAVSRFSLLSRQHDQPMATFIEVQGGTVTDEYEAGGNIGTTIQVKELFYNTPARLKFLKTSSTESGQIHDLLGKLALSRPDICFRLINNGRMVLLTPGNDSLADTLISLYGQKIAPDILPMEYTDETITITGYLGKPTLLKSNRQWQTIIVNGRIINSRLISKALENAYHSLLPKIGFPLAVLNLTIAADSIDVNVHPQKSEIKFADEQKLYRAIYKAVTTTLACVSSPAQLASAPEKVFVDHVAFNTHANTIQDQTSDRPSPTVLTIPFEQPSAVQTFVREETVSKQWLTEPHSQIIPEEQPQQTSTTSNTTFLQPLGQVNNCYIIANGEDGLYIIDQHAAHERILYDRLSRESERAPVQQLLIPLIFEFDLNECSIITEYGNIFYQLGFSLDEFGPNTFRLCEIPADIQQADALSIVRQILQLIQDMHHPQPGELRHAVLQMTACRAAVKAGDLLNQHQLKALINELFATERPFTCPHGRPSIIRLGHEELAKMFKRT